MRRLIVTADDFGRSREVNEAVEIGHRQGVLTAASLMVGAPAAEEAVAIAKANPRLGVGLHLVLVDGRPILPASDVSRLVDGAGAFRAGMATSGVRMVLDSRARSQLRAEIEAQFEAFAATGLSLDHVNAHKHFHLHPTIAELIRRCGARFGLRAVRVPVEPSGPLRRLEGRGARATDGLLRLWASGVRAGFRRAGLLAPDQVFGLAWSGAMTSPRLRGLIEGLPEGLTEIYLHPATGSDFAGAAPGYGYADELAALIAPEVVAAASRPDVRMGRFADFSQTGEE